MKNNPEHANRQTNAATDEIRSQREEKKTL